MQLKKSRPVHFIFALDESGSMYGEPWNDLIKALSETIDRIKPLKNAHISVINFNTKAEIIKERVLCTEVNPSHIPYRCGGTSFKAAFEKVY